jgi:hypothetical protein
MQAQRRRQTRWCKSRKSWAWYDSGLGWVLNGVSADRGKHSVSVDDVSAESLSLAAIRHVKHKATLNSKVDVKALVRP